MILKKISLAWIIIVFHVLRFVQPRKTVVKFTTFELDVNETWRTSHCGVYGKLVF